ncbi:MAG: hypothetical protein IKV61_01735 [Clostridia bacterium]|nr:hypothetical protein [Clostridia bacterium]
MLKDCVAVLDIQSSHIDVVIGEKSVNNTFIFRAKESVEYYTFFDGAFYDIKVLEEKISKLFIDIIEKNDISRISTCYVGVPGEFFKVLTTNYRIAFNKARRIAESDVKNLFDMAYEGKEDCGYTLINRTAVYYAIDGIRSDKVIGKLASNLSARLSFNMVSNNYKEVVGDILSRIGIKTIKFIPVPYAEAMSLFTKEERDATKILIDVGNVTTTISILSGNALLYSSAFALGGGLITAYLADKFKCDFEVAEMLKRKLNLGLRQNTLSKYVVFDDDNEFKFDRDVANNIAIDLLNEIAEQCDKELSKCTLKIPSDIETVFTGGGICFIRGAVEHITTVLGVFAKIAVPNQPHYKKPNCSSLISLLDVAIDTTRDKIFYYQGVN